MSITERFYQGEEEDSALLKTFKSLLDIESKGELEALAQRSHALTRERFGATMRLFAPLYLSNECVNNCKYCGFSRDNKIFRTTLTVEQVLKEAEHLHAKGFRNILLVAGEHPKFVSDGYLQECIRALKGLFPTIAVEVGPMEDHQYAELVEAGAEGLIVYQETYNKERYTDLHTSGPKRKFDWRMECPERAYRGGFRRIGVGALFGLSEWKEEAMQLARHLEYLYKTGWTAQYSVAFPRMRPYAGNYQYTPDPQFYLDDTALVKLICAFRLCFPNVGIVLSTREPAALRDQLLKLGVTHMSAGSATEPGGYTGAGNDDLHYTIKGRRVALEDTVQPCGATEQFKIDDERPVEEISALLQRNGYDPVWKDWDEAILTST